MDGRGGGRDKTRGEKKHATTKKKASVGSISRASLCFTSHGCYIRDERKAGGRTRIISVNWIHFQMG